MSRRTFRAALREARDLPTPTDDGGARVRHLSAALGVPCICVSGRILAIGPDVVDVTDCRALTWDEKHRAIAAHKRTHPRVDSSPPPVTCTVAPTISEVSTEPTIDSIEPPRPMDDGLDLPAFMQGDIIGLAHDESSRLERTFLAGQAAINPEVTT